MSKIHKYLLAALVVLNLGVFAAVMSSNTSYKVDFDTIVELWGDVLRDVDKLGLVLTTISVEKELEIGNETAKLVHANRDKKLEEYVGKVGAALAKHVRRKRISYHFYVIDLPVINAFALPGGHVYITKMMVNSFKSEAQLAAVLGHEIAHIDLKHCVENLQYQLMLQRVIGEDLSKVANVAYSLLRLGYSELQEREADSTGLIFAANTGYSPLAGIENSISLMARFKTNSPDAKKPQGPEGEVNRAIWKALKDHFQTHPPWDNRARELIALLNQNTTSWEGKTFYAGKSNLIDRKPLSEERREIEEFVFSHDIPEFLTERGELAMGVGDFHGAVGFFSRALALNPRSIRTLSLRVKAFEAQSDLEAAIVDLEAILSIKREALSKLAQRVEQAKQKQNRLSLEKHLTNLLDEYAQTKEVLIRLDAAANALKSKNAKDFSIQIDEIENAVLDARLTRADIRLEIGDLSGSLTDFAFVISKQPQNFAAVKARALVRIAQGKKQVALNELAESIRLTPSEPEFYRIRAEIFREIGMAERSERELGRYERFKHAGVPPLSESKWDKLEDLWLNKKDRKAFAIDTDPDSEIWQRTWDRPTAREAGLSALELCDRSAKASCALYSIGTSVVWGKSVEKLESEYDQYDDRIREKIKREIKQFSQNVEKGMNYFLLSRGKAYRKLRNHREAIEDFTEYLRDNFAAEAIYLRGRSYHALRQYDQAIADFTKITSAAGYQARAFRRRGFAHFYNGDLFLAERDFEQFIPLLSHDQAWGYLGRGTTRLFQDKYDLAIEDFNQALSKKPKNSAYNNQICWSMAIRALPAAALPYCNKAIKVRPAKPAYRDSRAFVYWQLHRKNTLDADIERAKWVDPSVPYAKNTEEGYANLIVEIFLTRNGYDVGPPNRNFDEKTKLAIEAYQNARGLAANGLITDDLIGHLSPLGFGSKRWVGVPQEYNNFSPSTDEIKSGCEKAIHGEIVRLKSGNGSVWMCNTDGSTVRPDGDAKPFMTQTIALQTGPEPGEAEYALAEKYAWAEGVKHSYFRAFKHYMSAAKLGHVKAQFALAAAYDAGRGVYKNDYRALIWFYVVRDFNEKASIDLKRKAKIRINYISGRKYYLSNPEMINGARIEAEKLVKGG